MGVVRVQGNARGTTDTDAITIAMTSAPISGNLVVLATVCAHDSNPAPLISSVAQVGVVWTAQKTQNLNTVWGSASCEIWVGVVGAGASDTITVTYVSAPYYGAVGDACEYKGLLTVGFLDKTASDAANDFNPVNTGTTATVSQENELWVGCGGTGVAQITATNGFTLLDGVNYSHPAHGGTINLAFLEKIVALGTSLGQANSETNAGPGWRAGCIITLRTITKEMLYLPFDEGAGANAYDHTDTHNGAITNPTWVGGRYGKSLLFTTTNFVTVPHASDITFTNGDFTVTFWIYTTDRDQNAGVMACKGEYQVDGWYIQNNPSTAGTFNFTSNQLAAFQQIASAVGAIVNNTWIFIAVVKSGATVTLYVNGADMTAGGGPSPITNPASSTRDLMVAGYVDGSNPTFNYFGAIDEFRLYNTALTADEIKQKYNDMMTGVVTGYATLG